MRQIVLDTETTGLLTTDHHRIIEIGCIELVNRKFTGKRYHQYLNPERPVDEGALAIHGLSNQFLGDKPLFNDIAEDFMDFIQGSDLIIHNAPFDIGFINYELSLAKKKWQTVADYCHITDTLALARQLHVGQRNNLDALCKRYKIDNSTRELHGALLDAHLLAQVYLAMTGGQGSLFDDLKLTDTEERVRQSNMTVTKKARTLVILKACPEELAAHEKKLEEFVS
jgi:DNA polymerase-3 subunit epsilon